MLIPVILSGGAGARLWPVSRESQPKPFMRLGGQHSLLQRTLSRALLVAEGGRVAVVTNREYFHRTREEALALPAMREFTLTQLLEPCGRNTAPAVAMAALWAQSLSEQALMLILPADHLIADEAAFAESARLAARQADLGHLVLFGISPVAPETGFGYIECAAVGDADGVCSVQRFIEKPDAARAIEFLAAGNFVWNSGMFCFRADVIIDALTRLAPEVMAAARETWQHSAPDPSASRIDFDEPTFRRSPDISIDYAVMERARNVKAVRAGFGWSDIGSWKAVAEQLAHDERGNTTVGETLLLETSNTHIQSDDRLVAAVGVDNLLVIDTPDALLVASKEASQHVREIVNRLKLRGHETARHHRTVSRPWGTYTVLQEGPRFKIKRIEVRPGESLSLQMHHHRSEHWIVVSGTARVTSDERTYLVAANESTYIPIGTRHRLENPGMVQLVMIEVQCGDYLGEDDIVRFSDAYGRLS